MVVKGLMDCVWVSVIYEKIIYFYINFFRHNFFNSVNLLCSCTLETENTKHFFSHRQNNLSTHTTFMNELNNISSAINSLNSTTFIRVYIYGDINFDNVANIETITATIKLIKTTKHFEKALFKLLIC